MGKIKPKTIRRRKIREYSSLVLKEMFSLGKEEVVKEVYYDKGNNVLVVETYLDFDEKKGDIWV